MDSNTSNSFVIFKFLSDLQQDENLQAKFRKEIETWNDPEVIRDNLRTSDEFSKYGLTTDQWDKIVLYRTEALKIANLCNDELQSMIARAMC